MTETINAAISEMELSKLEFKQFHEALNDKKYPVEGYEKKCIIIRMTLLEQNIDFLTRCIIHDLTLIPTEVLIPLIKPNQMKKAIDYEAKRKALENKKARLASLIPKTEDVAAANVLREDYRAICIELDLFYDDDQPKTAQS
ncbi:MAG: hypothetical protein ACXVJE_19450 [Mucilaginibacter sp.]